MLTTTYLVRYDVCSMNLMVDESENEWMWVSEVKRRVMMAGKVINGDD